MNLDSKEYINHNLKVNMLENYGDTKDPKADQPLHEIVFETGRLVIAYEDGLHLETERECESTGILIPFTSVKSVEIFNF